MALETVEQALKVFFNEGSGKDLFYPETPIPESEFVRWLYDRGYIIIKENEWGALIHDQEF